ncbi:MAG: hypothetical protein ACLRXA_17435 [Clostridium sp.]
MYLDAIFYFMVILAIMAVADIISTATRAMIPSMFSISVICIVLFWSGLLPPDVLELAGISSTLVYVIYYLQLPHMGALMSMREMAVQWKTIVICLAGLVGMCILNVTVGTLLLGKLVVLAGTPPLSGGIVAYMIVSEQANAMGRPDLSTLALAVFVLQSFVGYPLTAFFLKKEANYLLKNYRNGIVEGEKEAINSSKKPLIPQLPEKYNTTNTVLFKVAVAGVIGILITIATREFLSRYVILLIVGVILSEIGFLDRSPLIKSQVFGFSMGSYYWLCCSCRYRRNNAGRSPFLTDSYGWRYRDRNNRSGSRGNDCRKAAGIQERNGHLGRSDGSLRVSWNLYPVPGKR